MDRNMVRTQVYLPRTVYDRLQTRAEKHALTMAVQIRQALEDYLRRLESEGEEDVMLPVDPLRRLVGSFSSDLGDGAAHHDRYIYRRDWAAKPKRTLNEHAPLASPAHEPRAAYRGRGSKKGRRAK